MNRIKITDKNTGNNYELHPKFIQSCVVNKNEEVCLKIGLDDYVITDTIFKLVGKIEELKNNTKVSFRKRYKS